MYKSETIRTFQDLKAWQKSHQLALLVYEATRKYPKDEVFGLTNQIRRAAVSIAANIAEGFSRQTYKDKIRFYSMALGSLTELQSHLLISSDLGYVDLGEKDVITNQTLETYKYLYGLIRKSKETVRNS